MHMKKSNDDDETKAKKRKKKHCRADIFWAEKVAMLRFALLEKEDCQFLFNCSLT